MNNEQRNELETPSLELNPMAGTVTVPTVTQVRAAPMRKKRAYSDSALLLIPYIAGNASN